MAPKIKTNKGALKNEDDLKSKIDKKFEDNLRI